MNARIAQPRSGRAIAAVLLVALAALPLPARPVVAQQPLSALSVDVDAVVRSARGSVVSIAAEGTIMARASRTAAPKPRLHTRVGSGVAISEDEILTTASVVSGANRIVVTTSNGLQADAEVVGRDEVFNLALLAVRSLRLPPLRLAEVRPVQIGDWIIALGRTYGMKNTQSVGYVSFRYQEPHESLLQTTNAVYPGNSGVAALNTLGELVGIIQGELANRDAIQLQGIDDRNPGSVSFVLPVEVVKPVVQSLRREGRVRHGFLGVSTSAASVPSDSRPGTEVPIGAYVERVAPDGPGAAAGLQPGDLIVGFELERVETPAQLARWVSTGVPGQVVRLVWVRKDVPTNGRATLSESPYAAPQWATRNTLAPPAPDSRRIADLERRIQELNRELDELKGRKAPVPTR